MHAVVRSLHGLREVVDSQGRGVADAALKQNTAFRGGLDGCARTSAHPAAGRDWLGDSQLLPSRGSAAGASGPRGENVDSALEESAGSRRRLASERWPARAQTGIEA